jgi:hypothetical protein
MGGLLDFAIGAGAIAAPSSAVRAACVGLSLGKSAVAAVKKHRSQGRASRPASANGSSSADTASSGAVDLLFSDVRVRVRTKDGSKEILTGVSGRARAGR